MIAALIAVLLVAGALCVYAGAPNQRLFAAPLASRPARAAGCACLAAALAMLLALMGPASAVFTWTTGLMLVWTIFPIVIGWLRHRDETRT